MKKRIVVTLVIIAMAATALILGCSKSGDGQKTEAGAEQIYTCPMHPQVVSKEPGKCPICNMDLVLKKDAKVETASEQIHDTTKITYTCPMHPDVNSDQPGLCPDCNMKLVPLNATEQETMEHYGDSAKSVYTCPMHPDVISDRPGLCPHCNMNLEPKKPEPAPRDTAKGRSDLPQYTCGMHPQIVSNEPGLCPICNMNLVPKSDVSLSGGQIMVDAATQKKMGLAKTTASYRNLNKTIRAYGNVTYSEPDLFTVNLKIAGWVEKLYVNETGAKVTKGEPLLEIYSPELVAAQQECLIAWQSMQAMHAGDSVPTRLIDASFQKLKNWDISDEQIQKLMTTKKATRTLILTSPFDGVVTFKSVSEGDYILPGQDLYKIANLSTVWVSAFIFEQDLPLVNKGLNATVSSPSMPNNSFDSEIIYVSPFLNENRQAEIRLAVINDKLLLKPNMYAEVNIKKPLASTNLTVPRSALIKSGTREIVFVIAGQNLFQAREVHSGILSDQDYVEILHGLKAGEEVVTSGQFMLDSESRLQEALAENSRDKSATAAGHVH